LRARDGGVLVRAGQTEAAVDLSRLAGLAPGGVICEIMNDDGTMSRVPELLEFCGRHHMKMVSVAEIIRYRLQHERFIHRRGQGSIRTEFGDFRLFSYSSDLDPTTHLALVLGDVAHQDRVPVRMHSHCVAGDVFSSTQCDCKRLIRESLRHIAEAGCGALVYLHQTGPGLRTKGDQLIPHDRDDVFFAQQHEVGIGAQILSDLGLRRIRLLTNHPRKVVALQGFGIEIVEQAAVFDGTFVQ
jgi:3,4-dihydroxy 2-butanone 4-phosphate synthase/GTP cyclohydrolase II